MGGSVTLKINDKLSGTIEVEYDKGTDDFLFKGTIKPTQKHEPKDVKRLAGWTFDNSIPLVGIGVLNVVLNSGFFNFNLEMPHIEFRELTVQGSLKTLKNGKLPEISVTGFVGMGVSAALELGIGIAGQIQLLIATAEMGSRACSAPRLACRSESPSPASSAAITTVSTHRQPDGHAARRAGGGAAGLLQGQSVHLHHHRQDLGPGDVQAGVVRSAVVGAVEPFTINIGGSGPSSRVATRRRSGEAARPRGRRAKGSDQSQDEAKNAETKTKVRPVMQAIKTAAAKLEKLPPPGRACPSRRTSKTCGSCHRRPASSTPRKPTTPRAGCPNWPPRRRRRSSPSRSPSAASSRACWRHVALMGWRRAQVAHIGVNPDTGVDVVAEREEVQVSQEQKYQVDLVAAGGANGAGRRVGRGDGRSSSRTSPRRRRSTTRSSRRPRSEYDHKVTQHEKEAQLATTRPRWRRRTRRRKARKRSRRSRRRRRRRRRLRLARAAAALAKPEPIAKKPPIPMPVPPPPVPRWSFRRCPTRGGGADIRVARPRRPRRRRRRRRGQADSAGAAASQGASAGGKSVSVGGGGGGGGGGGKGNAAEMGIGAPGKGGGGGGGGPATVEGPGNLSAQAKALNTKLATYGGGAPGGKGGAAGGAAAGRLPRPRARSAGAPAAPRRTCSRCSARRSSRRAAGCAPGGPVPLRPALADVRSDGAAVVRPMRGQKVVDAGHKDEDAKKRKRELKEQEFKQKIEAAEAGERKGEAKLKEAATKKHAENEKKKKKDPSTPSATRCPPTETSRRATTKSRASRSPTGSG